MVTSSCSSVRVPFLAGCIVIKELHWQLPDRIYMNCGSNASVDFERIAQTLNSKGKWLCWGHTYIHALGSTHHKWGGALLGRSFLYCGSEKLCTYYPVPLEPWTPYSRNHVLCTPSSKLCTQYFRYHVLPSEIWQKSGVIPIMFKN